MKEVLTDFGVMQSIDDDAATWMQQSASIWDYTVIPTLLGLSSLHQAIFIWKMTKMELTIGSLPQIWWVKRRGVCIIGADISTDKPLRDTGQFFIDTVDQIITYGDGRNRLSTQLQISIWSCFI